MSAPEAPNPSTDAPPSAQQPDPKNWLPTTLTTIPPSGRALLESWSGIPPSDVLAHVQRVRDRAFAIHAWPCIGQAYFVDTGFYQSPWAAQALALLRSGGTFLDAGCCFGQELRFLQHRDGIPGARLFGFDLEPAFVEIGYELFGDRERVGATMVGGDLMKAREAPENEGLVPLEGRMDVVNVSLVLHVFGWEDMVTAAKRLVAFTKPRPGSMIVGFQIGSVNPGEHPMPLGRTTGYRHDGASLERFWTQVGDETGTSWKVESELKWHDAIAENRERSWAQGDPGMRVIWFAVTRV